MSEDKTYGIDLPLQCMCKYSKNGKIKSIHGSYNK